MGSKSGVGMWICLCGRERTGDEGMVEFRTIYPGCYPCRTVDVQVMAQFGGTTLTSQL